VSQQSAGIRAFEGKVSAQLQEAKSQIEGIEAHAKGTMAQAEIDAINGFKTKRKEIDKKRQDLKTAGEAKATQLKAEIEADMTNFKTSLDQFTTKVKSQVATK
jgi:uncharacterized protein involved in exopolysaccharide biosynthesis